MAKKNGKKKCGCQWERDSKKDHDWLLGIESGGIDGVVCLLTRAVTWDDREYSDLNVIAPFQFADFAAEHNWQRPGLIRDLAFALSDAWQGCAYREEAFSLKKCLRAVAAGATAAAETTERPGLWVHEK